MFLVGGVSTLSKSSYAVLESLLFRGEYTMRSGQLGLATSAMFKFNVSTSGCTYVFLCLPLRAAILYLFPVNCVLAFFRWSLN